MNAIVALMPGETELERTKSALAQAALLIAFEAGGIDPLVLYDVRGSSEETRWRHVWLYLVRGALDIREADIARALTHMLVGLGQRSARAIEPTPKEGEVDDRTGADKPVHHDTIANACHHIEDLRGVSAAAEAEIERMGEELIEKFVNHRLRFKAMNDAWEKLKEDRKRERRARA